MKFTHRTMTAARRARLSAISLAVGTLLMAGSLNASAAPFAFDMAVAAAAAGCVPKAQGHVTIEDAGANQRMQVRVNGLPPHTEFALFVLQTPTAPFGMSWYQGDIVTDENGSGSQQFFGIFSRELFVFAPATRAAPQTDPGIDAALNPVTAPVHTYHLGLWFSDPADAANANCPGNPTPFEGNHRAGIQVLNTGNFGAEAADGPLAKFE